MLSLAHAQSAGATQDPLLSLLPLILMFVVLYFLMIRPQMKRAKEHKTLVENLQKQDEDGKPSSPSTPGSLWLYSNCGGELKEHKLDIY